MITEESALNHLLSQPEVSIDGVKRYENLDEGRYELNNYNSGYGEAKPRYSVPMSRWLAVVVDSVHKGSSVVQNLQDNGVAVYFAENENERIRLINQAADEVPGVRFSLAQDTESSIYDANEMLANVGMDFANTAAQREVLGDFIKAHDKYVKIRENVSDAAEKMAAAQAAGDEATYNAERIRFHELVDMADKANTRLQKMLSGKALNNVMSRANNMVRQFVLDASEDASAEQMTKSLADAMSIDKGKMSAELMGWVKQYADQRRAFNERMARDKEYRHQSEHGADLKRAISRMVKRLTELRLKEQDYKNIPEELKPLVDLAMQKVLTHDAAGRGLVYDKKTAANRLADFGHVAQLDIDGNTEMALMEQELLNNLDQLYAMLSALEGTKGLSKMDYITKRNTLL